MTDEHFNVWTTARSELPFSQWSTDEIAGWFHDMGLQLYASDIQRWVTRGKQLLEVSPTEMEKELAIKNPLHKKKIILALEAKGRQQDPMTPITILPGIHAYFCSIRLNSSIFILLLIIDFRVVD